MDKKIVGFKWGEAGKESFVEFAQNCNLGFIHPTLEEMQKSPVAAEDAREMIEAFDTLAPLVEAVRHDLTKIDAEDGGR